MTEYQAIEYNNSGLSSYSLLTLSEFIKRPDVNLDLPNKIYNRYHVIDWEFYFMPSHILRSFVFWLAEIYVYGEVGLLKYWSDQLRRFPPIKISNTQQSIFDLSADQLPLDQLLFFPLKQ
ncbi:hypothetical protein [Crocosphaera sp. XPORK-15E]|uniref:hypothetical protein n=1 Tax=Crocosphaera sp. XPORK-15E TaxID=3110247 RepID=UPI002B214C38|nr:hypothetical protein [Crocosphaera sp. XPORK-15E]MEA5533671.1 hypothetical protein [Crocosphaera sp. XPORK-15E]